MKILLLLLLAQTETASTTEPAITQMPAIKQAVDAAYPERALSERLDATVLLELDIDDRGLVTSATVAVPSEAPGFGFEASAIEAAQQLTFHPAEAGGVPIPVRIAFTYHFRAPPPPKKVPEKQAPVPEEALVKLTGRVINALDERAAMAARVVVYRSAGEDVVGFEAEADEEGRFVFYDLEPGIWKIHAELTGHRPLRRSVKIPLSGSAAIRLRLEAYNQYDVIVLESRRNAGIFDQELGALSTTVPSDGLRGRGVGRIAVRRASRGGARGGGARGSGGGRGGGTRPSGTGGRTPPTGFPGGAGGVRGGGLAGRTGPINAGTAVASLTADVAAIAETTGGVIIRGADPHSTSLQVDSAVVPILYHYGDLRGILPPAMVERTRYQSGNFPVYYGRATGGILDLELSRLDPDDDGGYVDVNAVDASVYIESTIDDDGNISFAYRRSYLDLFLADLLPKSTAENVSWVPQYYDYQVLGNYRFGRHELQAFFFSAEDRLQELVEESESEETDSRIRFYRGALRHRWAPNRMILNEVELSLGFDRQEQSETVGDRLQVQARETFRWKIDDELSFNFGIDYLARELSGTAESMALIPGSIETTVVSLDQGFAHYPAGFLELQWRPDEDLLVVPGLRLDHFGRVAETTFDPRLTARHQLLESLGVRAGVGLFHQEPTFGELHPELGNPDLFTESAIHYAIGARWQPFKALLFDLTIFYEDQSSVTVPSDGTVERNGETVPENFTNTGEGRSFGAEARASIAREEFVVMVAYTLARAELQADEDAEYETGGYDQTHVLSLVGSYQLPGNWEIGVRWRLASGTVTTLVSGSIFSEDARAFLPLNSAGRWPLFHQLDLRVDKRWFFQTWNLSAYLDIQNAYNRGNVVEGFSYNVDYTEARPQTGLPFFPNVGVMADF